MKRGNAVEMFMGLLAGGEECFLFAIFLEGSSLGAMPWSDTTTGEVLGSDIVDSGFDMSLSVFHR